MKLAIFIDYDNLLAVHKSSGILDVATKALLRTPLSSQSARGTCDIRIYGGWYEGPKMTQLAQKLAVAIANEFPAIIRVPGQGGGIVALAVNVELAVAMMEEPSHHLFDTYRKKGLPVAKKLLKSGKCPVSSCSVTADDLIYRHEQKIVDTMLTCDMVYAPTQNYGHLILVSSDDDFLPPLRTVLLRGTPVARFHPHPNRNRIPLGIRGTQLTDIDL